MTTMLKSLFATEKSRSLERHHKLHLTANQPPRRRISALAIATGTLLAIGAGVLAGVFYGERHEYQGKIQFTPLPAQEATKLLLPIEDAKGLATLLKSPENLNKVIQELELPVAAAALEKQIDVKTPFGNQVIAVFLKWQGHGDGDVILDRIMQTFVDSAAEMRESKVQARLLAFQNSLAVCDREVQKARQDHAEFLRKHGQSDLAQEIQSTTTKLESIAHGISQAYKGKSSGQAQAVLIESAIERLAREDADSGEDGVGGGLIPPNLAKPRPTPERLQYMIQEERQKQVLHTQIATKRKELQRLQTLDRMAAASPLELDRVRGELAALETQVTDNGKVQQWREALADSNPSLKAALLQAVISKKFDLELELRGYEKNLEFMLQAEKDIRNQMTRLNDLQREATPLAQQVQSRESERQRLQAHIDQLKLFKELGAGELTVVQPAVASSVGSGRRWLIRFAAGLGAFMAFFGLVSIYRTRVSAPSSEEGLTDMGLSTLGRLPRGKAPKAAQQEIRSLSLLLRQRLPEVGASILFSSVRNQPIDDLVSEIGTCYARRDEKVLIIDGVLPESRKPGVANGAPGLAEYLACKTDKIEDLIKPSKSQAFDVLTAGNAIIPPDALATQRMQKLMAQLRKNYTLILVKGHSATKVTDLEILAGYQDAVVFVFEEADTLRLEEMQAIRTHLEADIPLLGCVAMNRSVTMASA